MIWTKIICIAWNLAELVETEENQGVFPPKYDSAAS
jgi:hypothetical protein